jgi:hypothetical protein
MAAAAVVKTTAVTARAMTTTATTMKTTITTTLTATINQLKKIGNHLLLPRHLVTIKGSSYARGFHSHLG